ncbi:MAG TPA: phosphatase PAP2 family protein [Acidimicrobiales bacterium]|nr:phosphatase PAP2 family protein [Acidimicrobiales bacterium]
MTATPRQRPAVSLLHRDPPMTPMRFFGGRPVGFAVAVAALIVLTILAAFQDGKVLLVVDEPIMRWVVAHRTDTWTDVFSFASHFGDNIVVFSLAIALAAWTWPRCRFLAGALLLAAAIRPGLEFLLKGAVARPRPDLSPLGIFHGPSYPSGHPLAAASLWGLLPAVVAMHTHNKVVWWISVGFSGLIIAGVAAARVYKGAHHPTDVVASLAFAGLYLALVQGFFDRFHGARDCRHPQHSVQTELVDEQTSLP